ncbi:tyrosine-type recombinase/integrase [Streptomyces sp. NPDC058686]|uniref:tyrosine-type recombinase/integrase n=1 Tax=Streptomyces sp. NPDC058686 TaxID=3346599 RepID=UPI0036493912
MADLFEVLIGTGMRRGEALGLHWDDVRLDECVLYVRCRLSAIDNNRLVLTTPKTRSRPPPRPGPAANWVAISPRVAAALRHRARTVPRAHNDAADPLAGPVFSRPDGRPLGPHLVLDRLHRLSDDGGVPRITVHDLRHLAATITAGVPLTSAERLKDRPRPPTWLRPPRDHIRSLRDTLHRLRNPTPPVFSTAAGQHRPRRATTLRPPHPRKHGRPPSRSRENGLRPATTQVGTTGFEPAPP